MAEEKQEDLSMDDILSSIKNILMEDNAVQAEAAPAPQPQSQPAPVVAAPKTPEPVIQQPAAPVVQTKIAEPEEDDVFQLSKSMMIDDTNPFNIPDAKVQESPAEDKNEDFDLSADFDIDDLQLPSFEEIEEEPQPQVQAVAESVSAPILDDEVNNLLDGSDEVDNFLEASEDDIDLPLSAAEVEAPIKEEAPLMEMPEIDVEADPFDIEHVSPVMEPEAFMAEPEQIIDVEAEPIYEPEAEERPVFSAIDVDAEPIYEPEASIALEDEFINSTVEENPYQDQAVVEADSHHDIFSPEFEEPEAQDIIAPQTNIEDDKAVDAVDASANIINNFAKIFAQKQEERAAEPIVETKKEETPAVEYKTMPNLAVGSASLTIEDMVKEVIENVVGQWVRENLDKEIPLQEIADRKVSSQTQTWLDANLPAMVESIVKKEIERVMAKVGS